MCRVLIIDDEDVICNMLLYAFSYHGIDAEIAENGDEGLAKFNQEHFDVVITDMLMPGLDGNVIARHIRRSNRPDTPIIGISGTAWLLNEKEYDAIFEKPFSINLLLETVENLTTRLHRAIA